jgi:outer membrane protein assembly factor BamE (lipoprotein component of BamABCDE complex)
MKRKLDVGHGIVPLLLLGSTLLAACAGYTPGDLQPGTPIGDVIARMGQPTGEYRGPDGMRRVEFARGPAGKHTYMVDVNPQGQVVKWEQVLTDQKFSALMVGMSEADVLYTIGRPSEVLSIPRRQEQVWSYRYPSYETCIWFQVNIDQPTKKVTQLGHGIDWKCDPGDLRAR